MNKKAHIYIVDDEPGICRLIKHLFRGSGCDVTEINSGRGVLKMLNNEGRPDIILLDIMMPEMDGFEVCRKIKNDKKHRKIKVLFYSALPADEVSEKAEEAGADGYITKAEDIDSLSKKVMDIIVR